MAGLAQHHDRRCFVGRKLGKEVRAQFRTDPRILGGVVVRVGDRVFDGSVRRRMSVLRRRMLGGQ